MYLLFKLLTAFFYLFYQPFKFFQRDFLFLDKGRNRSQIRIVETLAYQAVQIHLVVLLPAEKRIVPEGTAHRAMAKIAV